MLNYLSIVDNIYQDIPMASVMLSSIGKFTEEELVKLRVLIEEPVRGKYTLYDFMRLYMQEGTEEELKKKIRDFLMDLLYFRQQKRNSRLAHCCGIFTRGQVFIMMCSLCRMEKREKKIF